MRYKLARRIDIFNVRGFTLIELLVVIAIVGMLASVVMASLNAARIKSRDTRRLADIRTLQQAIENYYTDNGYYPHTSWVSSYAGTWESTLGADVQSFLPTLPVDPVNESSGHAYDGHLTYSYWSAGYGTVNDQPHWYMLLFNLEDSDLHAEWETRDGVTACDGTSFDYPAITVGGDCLVN